MPIVKSLVAWLVILCLAMANGVLREATLIPALGKSSSLLVSGVLLAICVSVVAYLFVRLVPGLAMSGAVRVGSLWLGLTLVFEFGIGRVVQHKSWTELLGAYTFRDGNIWPVVLLVTLLAPALAVKAIKSRSQ